MGLFDSVWADCPNDECDGRIEWQSKAGDSYMVGYTLQAVPAAIAGDISGEVSRCLKCGTAVKIEAAIPIPTNVQMRIIPVPDVK